MHHFAADVDPVQARVMYAVQQPVASSTVADVMGPPAWKSFPTWYLVARDDEAIPPDAERQFAARMGATAIEISSSHVAMVSHSRRGGAAHRDRCHGGLGHWVSPSPTKSDRWPRSSARTRDAPFVHKINLDCQ